uniref:ATP synthase complex subunit 8 n=1 Tax=Macrocephalon maleo TaxID=177178 RepID=A0A8F7CEI1_MACML|nr:ATP synthase F0 subunit 8 [Macrocephalon maleo]
MPQLNPNPWFIIMVLTWLTFSLLIQPKLLSFTSANPPSSANQAAPKTNPWAWPWT